MENRDRFFILLGAVFLMAVAALVGAGVRIGEANRQQQLPGAAVEEPRFNG